jgi:DNA-directed RNA polymerase subunit F
VQIRWLQYACRVSSVTEEGLDNLKHEVLELMTEESWATQIEAMQTRDSQELNLIS